MKTFEIKKKVKAVQFIGDNFKELCREVRKELDDSHSVYTFNCATNYVYDNGVESNVYYINGQQIKKGQYVIVDENNNVDIISELPYYDKQLKKGKK